MCAQVEASSLTQAAFPVLLAGAELAVAGAGVGVGGGSGAAGDGARGRRAGAGGGGGRAPLERAATVQRLEPQQASFVERLWAYLTVSGRGVAGGALSGRGRERCACGRCGSCWSAQTGATRRRRSGRESWRCATPSWPCPPGRS